MKSNKSDGVLSTETSSTGETVYTLRGLAMMWGVSPVEIRKAINDGSLRARKVGPECLITEEAVREFLCDHDAKGKVPAFERGDVVAFYLDGDLRDGLVLEFDEHAGKLTVEIFGQLAPSAVELDQRDAQVLTLRGRIH